MKIKNLAYHGAFLGAALLAVQAYSSDYSTPAHRTTKGKYHTQAIKKKKKIHYSNASRSQPNNPFPESTPQTRIPNGVNAPSSDYAFTIRKGSVQTGNPFPETTPRSRIPKGVGISLGVVNKTDLSKTIAEMSITGYVKGDFIYDFTKDNLLPFWAPRVITQNDNNPHLLFIASETRLRIKSKFDSSIGLINTWVEGDFFGNPGDQTFTNANQFRLRKAWGEWFIIPAFSIRIGQDDSTFVNLFAFPETIDFGGPVGVSQIRQAQVRLTYEKNKLAISVSAENPEGTFTTSGGGPIPIGTGCSESTLNLCGANDENPDFAARIQYATPDDRAMFQLSGLLRELIAGTDKGLGGFNTPRREMAYGVLGAIKVKLNSVFELEATSMGGQGIGRYIFEGGLYQGGLFNTINTRLSLIHAWGADGAIIIHWSKTLRSNLVFGTYQASQSDLILGMVAKEYTGHVNLLWQPIERLQFGAEGMYGKIYNLGEPKQDAYRMQLAGWFFF